MKAFNNFKHLLAFVDDLPNEPEEARFRRHNRFLRSLREDTLLIADNFNVTATRDGFLDVMLKCRCRILFTTRCLYENYVCLEQTELSKDGLPELAEKRKNILETYGEAGICLAKRIKGEQ